VSKSIRGPVTEVAASSILRSIRRRVAPVAVSVGGCCLLPYTGTKGQGEGAAATRGILTRWEQHQMALIIPFPERGSFRQRLKAVRGVE
jgi:hypothetical protein